jgi:beta-glucanase (GH16 family)
MKVLVIFGLVCVVGIAHAEYVKVWEDEFDGGNLADRWNFELGCNGWGNQEMQCYTNNRGENVRQEGGKLIIQARKEWWGDGTNDLPFTSARMTSKAAWTFGKFEMRARLPKGKHLWPAFWMMPQGSNYGGWPRSGEIDIMEYRGQRPQQILGTLHFGESPSNKGQAGTGERDFPLDFSQDFHTFGLDWNQYRVQWLLDDQVYHEESVDKNFWPGLYTNNVSPFDQNFFFILNLAVGGSFFNGEPFNPDEADGWAKDTYEIEWVRKWEWQ